MSGARAERRLAAILAAARAVPSSSSPSAVNTPVTSNIAALGNALRRASKAGGERLSLALNYRSKALAHSL